MRWREDGHRARLPGEVWEAILRYLEASKRLESMTAGKYIFAPLADPWIGVVKGVAEEWLEGKAVSPNTLRESLKLYGKLVGIPEERLTLAGLRNTAIWLRMEGGASLEEMQVFLDSQGKIENLKYSLRKFRKMTENRLASDWVGSELQSLQHPERVPQPPNRTPKPFKSEDWYRHGFYAKSQPVEEVAKVLAMNIQGIGSEIAGLRILGRGLLERQVKAKSSQESARLGDVYTKTAARLADMMRFEQKMAQDTEGKSYAEEFIERIDEVSIVLGYEPAGYQIRARMLGEGTEMDVEARLLVEEIASIRYVLMNTFKLAMEEDDDREYCHLVEIFSVGCSRLVRLLRLDVQKYDRLQASIQEAISEALRQVNEEFRLGTE